MDKTGITTSSKIWPDLTCAISVRRKGQILLVVGIPVLSTTLNIQFQRNYVKNQIPSDKTSSEQNCSSLNNQMWPFLNEAKQQNGKNTQNNGQSFEFHWIFGTQIFSKVTETVIFKLKNSGTP